MTNKPLPEKDGTVPIGSNWYLLANQCRVHSVNEYEIEGLLCEVDVYQLTETLIKNHEPQTAGIVEAFQSPPASGTIWSAGGYVRAFVTACGEAIRISFDCPTYEAEEQAKRICRTLRFSAPSWVMKVRHDMPETVRLRWAITNGIGVFDAIDTLVDMGLESEGLEIALAATADKNQVIRRGACEVLGGLGDQCAIDTLTNLLRDESMLVRIYAAEALWYCQDSFCEEAVETFVEGLNCSDVQESVCLECGETPVPNSYYAALALSEIGPLPDRLLDALVEVSKNSTSQIVKTVAAECLAKNKWKDKR